MIRKSQFTHPHAAVWRATGVGLAVIVILSLVLVALPWRGTGPGARSVGLPGVAPPRAPGEGPSPALHEVVTTWGSGPASGDGEFDNPSSIAVNTTGQVYVVESNNHRVQVFDQYGNFLFKWGSSGSGDGQFNSPFGIAVNATGHVYVTESGNDRVQVFDQCGHFLFKWGGTEGDGDGEFNYPLGIEVNATGHVYVADSGNDRVQVFDQCGNFLSKWGVTGSADGQFSNPFGIRVNATGQVYVTDTGNGRVQVFDRDVIPPSYGTLVETDDPIAEQVDQALTCTITDGSAASGLAGAVAYFRVGAGSSWDHNNNATFNGDTATIGAGNYTGGETVYYYLAAWDNFGNINYDYSGGASVNEADAQASPHSFVAFDETSPSIGDVTGEGEPVVAHLNKTLSCIITDTGGSGLSWAVAYFKVGIFSGWDPLNNATFTGDTATIGAGNYTGGDTLYFYLAARDGQGNCIYRNNDTTTTAVESFAQVRPYMFEVDGLAPTIWVGAGEDDPVPEQMSRALNVFVTDEGGSGLAWARAYFRTQA